MHQNSDNIYRDSEFDSSTFSQNVFSKNRYLLEMDEEKAIKIQDMLIEYTEDEQIRCATYKSGAIVRRLNTFTLVKSACNQLWLGDRFGSWHPLD